MVNLCRWSVAFEDAFVTCNHTNFYAGKVLHDRQLRQAPCQTAKLFQEVFPEARLAAQHATPKGLTEDRKVRHFELYGHATIIAGEPLHDFFI